jgi:hypothetical protein
MVAKFDLFKFCFEIYNLKIIYIYQCSGTLYFQFENNNIKTEKQILSETDIATFNEIKNQNQEKIKIAVLLLFLS